MTSSEDRSFGSHHGAEELRGERELFQLPSERFAREQRQHAAWLEDAREQAPISTQPSTDKEVPASKKASSWERSPLGAVDADAVARAPITLSIHELFQFFAYCDIFYSCDDIPGGLATVTMPIRDRDRFLRFRSNPSSVILGGWSTNDPSSSERATITLTIPDLDLLGRYWSEVCGKSNAFDPVIVVTMPPEERVKFDEYVASQRRSPAFASRAQQEVGQENKGGSGCTRGCLTTIAALVVGLIVTTLIMSALFIGIGMMNDSDGQTGSQDGVEKVLVGRIWKAGDAAYVSQIADPEAQDEVLTYLFVPAEIEQPGDEAFRVTTELWLNPDGADLSESRLFSDASIMGIMEVDGYDALYHAVYKATFDRGPGTYWVLYAFDISSVDPLGDEVYLLVFDEGTLVKTFAYQTQCIELDELEGIAQAEMSREG